MILQPDSCAAFTVCNLAYLSRALVLAESYLLHNNARIIIFVCDRKIIIEGLDDIADIRWIEDLGIPNLGHLSFKYDVTEFTTALKPLLTLSLLEKYEKVVFFDPDICIYHPVDDILKKLKTNPILLTPHYTTPEPNEYQNSDISMMRFGSVNLGFFAVRKSTESLSFLRWLDNRCQRFCFFETQFGLSTDQKWVSIAPCLFRGIHITFDPGYNAAFWNIRERKMRTNGSGGYMVNDSYPLIFFHFSSFDEKAPERLTKRPLHEDISNRTDIRQLSLAYSAQLANFQKRFPSRPYSFDFMSNGDYISPTLRRAYACVAEELSAGHDPFDSSGPVGAFARRNHLLEKRCTGYVPAGFNDVKTNSLKFSIINMVMRMLLRVIGPNSFTNFSRLLVYLSSFRQNRGLWRL